MGTREWIFSIAAILIGGGVIVALLWAAAGRRPDGSTDTVLQVDAENRSVFDKRAHSDWDGEVRITRPTDPAIVKQVQRVNTPEDEA
jgi:hypothetical protein